MYSNKKLKIIDFFHIVSNTTFYSTPDGKIFSYNFDQLLITIAFKNCCMV